MQYKLHLSRMFELRQMSKTGNHDWHGRRAETLSRFGGAPADVAFLGFPVTAIPQNGLKPNLSNRF